MFSQSVSFLRFIMAFMVVLIHAPFLLKSEAVWNNGWDCTLWIVLSRVICQTAVPTFYMVSGYYFFSHFEMWSTKVYLDKLKKRVKTLLVPYLLWNTLFIIPTLALWAMGIMDTNSIKEYFEDSGYLRIYWDCNNQGVVQTPNIIGILMGSGYPQDGPLWFVRDLMVMCLLSPIVYYLIKKARLMAVLLGGAFYVFNIFIPVSGFSSSSMFFFLLGGYFMLERKDPIDQFKKIKYISISGSVIFMLLSSLYYSNNNLLYMIFMRTFNICAIPLMFLTVSYFINQKVTVVCQPLSNCSFFIFAAHFYFSFKIVSYPLNFLVPALANRQPFIHYLILAIMSTLLLVCIKLLIDKFVPKLSLYLNGFR